MPGFHARLPFPPVFTLEDSYGFDLLLSNSISIDESKPVEQLKTCLMSLRALNGRLLCKARAAELQYVHCYWTAIIYLTFSYDTVKIKNVLLDVLTRRTFSF